MSIRLPLGALLIIGVLGVSGCGGETSATSAESPTAGESAQPYPAGSPVRSTPPPGCPPALGPSDQIAVVDYIDTFVMDDKSYVAAGEPPPPFSPGSDAPAGVVRCQIGAYPVSPSYGLKDGDATRLKVGTEIYLVEPGSPASDAVALVGTGWRLYRLVPAP